MAKSKGTRGKDYYSSQYMKTEANLARKGKTNKKKSHAGYKSHVK